jgi:[acyl-carrier-protein] S-malonyltransferase
MGHALFQRHPAARAVFDQADALLGFSLSQLCFFGPAETLTDTINQQPALFVTGLATWQVMQQATWAPATYFAGHSLGEFTALVAAGALSFADGLALVRRRGELMKAAGEKNPGAMAAILGLDIDRLQQLCAAAAATTGEPVQVANDNCPGQVVISGDKGALAEAVRLAEKAGALRVIHLPITIAAHSPLMGGAAADFAAAVATTPFTTPSVPVIANTSAAPLTSPDAIRAELTAQLTGNVRWTESMRHLRAHDVEEFIEIGPGNVLTNLMKRIDRKAKRQAVDLETL